MRTIFLLLLLAGLLTSNAQTIGFKAGQLRNQRVSTAYQEKEESLKSLLLSKGVEISKLNIYIRVFKREKILEIYGKNKTSKKFQLIREYEICRNSGVLGPKRKEGDLQVPEGFYLVNDFNPVSNFYLSLGINYPNESDRILTDQLHPGGDIYIHGNCVTIGCMPVTDDKIQEIYLLAVEAKNNGQKEIHVDIFPAKLTNEALPGLTKEFPAHASFWENLKLGYDYFEKHKTIPAVKVDRKGAYIISKTSVS